MKDEDKFNIIVDKKSLPQLRRFTKVVNKLWSKERKKWAEEIKRWNNLIDAKRDRIKKLEDKVKRIAEHRRKLHVTISDLLQSKADLIKKIEKLKVKDLKNFGIDDKKSILLANKALNYVINLIKGEK